MPSSAAASAQLLAATGAGQAWACAGGGVQAAAGSRKQAESIQGGRLRSGAPQRHGVLRDERGDVSAA